MKKGMLYILAANIIFLLINILNSFLIPKFLSINTFSILKTYSLYIGYAGFLSLGYADGMYLKYGGRNINNINSTDFSTNYKSYLLLQMIVSILCLFISLILKDFVLICFSIGSFFINIIGYYKNLYQAVGEFKLYGKSLNYQTILIFIMNMVLIFVINTDYSSLYIIIQILASLIVTVYLTITLNKKIKIFGTGKISFDIIRNNIVAGFTLMLGNFSSSIFTSLDRWFIKVLMSSVSFAYYSFAVSLENIVNVFVTPITVSLYNEFCKRSDEEYILKIKKLTLLWGFLVISASYPVEYIILNYLPQYKNSISIIFILFATQALYAVIKGIHVNLYKAERKQKKYFKIMIIMTLLSIIFNFVLYFLLKNVDSFAIATFITSVVWLLYCEYENRVLRFKLKEYIAIILIFTIYFMTGKLNSSIIAFTIYLISLISIIFIFFNDTINIIYKNLIKLKKLKEVK